MWALSRSIVYFCSMMNTHSAKKLYFITLWISLTGLVYGQVQDTPSGPAVVSDQVNIALRAAGDRLMDISGDSTSTIPPVELLGNQSYRLDLNHHIIYDSLASVLEQTFTRHQISGPYQVALLDCNTDEVLLGYSSLDLKEGFAACMGRDQPDSCYQLMVTFIPARPATMDRSLMMGFLALLAAGIFLPILYVRRKSWFGNNIVDTSPATAEDSDQISFGTTSLDVGRQTLHHAGKAHKLTYRETKLLSVLANHPNKVLSRDQLMASVWEDEGIVVGRSLDVFISRLRKKLKDDPAVQISNAHGVGYKLEVSA